MQVSVLTKINGKMHRWATDMTSIEAPQHKELIESVTEEIELNVRTKFTKPVLVLIDNTANLEPEAA